VDKGGLDEQDEQLRAFKEEDCAEEEVEIGDPEAVC
jgi:hypothetical protein